MSSEQKPQTDHQPSGVASNALLDCAIALLEMAKCPDCDGGGAIQVGGREYVTHDMACDAGDMSMEGSLYREAEWQQCQWCDEKDALIAKWKAQSNAEAHGRRSRTVQPIVGSLDGDK